MRVTLFTIAALIAFAANSLLCRMALANGYIDPWSFTTIRLLSAAICLTIIMVVSAYSLRKQSNVNKNDNANISAISQDDVLTETGSWLSSLSLVVYALLFSLAYVELATGTGALVLFAAVQFTMIGWGIYKKEPLSSIQWLALGVAFTGFVYLMLPSATAPSLFGAIIMAISGIAWGIYSIRGKTCVSPLRATGFNFIRSLLALPLLLLIGISDLTAVKIEGILLAGVSGALSSGIGYSLWYVAMPLLKSTQAAIVQLCVPILAAIMGVLFLSEPLTLRFVIASVVILGAVLIFILNNKTLSAPATHPKAIE